CVDSTCRLLSGGGAARHHGTSVPVRPESPRNVGTNVPPGRLRPVEGDGEQGAAANPLPADGGRRAARLGRGRRRPPAGPGVELADPPLVRMGEPPPAAPDPLS